MEKKNNEPMLPMMDFREEQPVKNSTLSFIDENDEPQEERIPTNRPLRFDQDYEETTVTRPRKPETPVAAPKAEAPIIPTTPKQEITAAPQPQVQQPQTPKPQPQIQQPQAPKPQAQVQQPQVSRPVVPQQKTDEENSPLPKAIKLFVVNGAGISIQNFSINGKPVDYGQTITFRDERDIYDLTVSADGFKDRRIQVTRADRKKGDKRVMLVSQAQSFIVSFNTPEGTKRGQIELEQTSPIYEYIKEASHTDTPLNMLNINGVGGGIPDQRGKISLRPFLIVFVIGILLGWGITALFAGGSDSSKETEDTELVETPDETLDNTAIADNKKDDVQQEETLSTVKEEPQEERKDEEKEEEKLDEPKLSIPERDINYLKQAEGEVWKINQMESDACRKMMQAFATGNIEYLISSQNAYNEVPKAKRNGYYNKILADLQTIKTQTNYEEAKKALAQECHSGSFDLRTVLDRMHRMLK